MSNVVVWSDVLNKCAEESGFAIYLLCMEMSTLLTLGRLERLHIFIAKELENRNLFS
jgi:hypothetical protein